MFRHALSYVPPNMSAPYAEAFRLNCHVLIQVGYVELQSKKKLRDTVEEDISMYLVEAIENFFRSPNCPSWARRFTVRDEAPQNKPNLPAKQRPRVDVAIESTSSGRPCLHFEAKRLNRTKKGKHAKAYFGTDGLGCFLDGRYGTRSNHGGMLGYIQSDDPNFWNHELDKYLKSNSAAIKCLGNNQWSRQQVANGPAWIFSTKHDRSIGASIEIWHTLLDFT